MIGRIVATVFIFVCTCAAWVFLGGVVHVRSTTQDSKLRSEVGHLWGTAQAQKAPEVTARAPKKIESETRGDASVQRVPLKSTRIDAVLSLDYRQKGLFWYSTYRVRFSAKYAVANDTPEPRVMDFAFTFPSEGAVYDNFRFAVGGRDEENIKIASGKVSRALPLEPGQVETIEVSYGSQGMDMWWYDFGDSVNQVRDFQLTMNTDFDNIDFPQNCISPTSKTKTAQGWELKWEYLNLLTGVRIGMELPHKLNPGPWVSQVTFAAPVSLFFFFFVMFIFTTWRGIKVHPMNYFFIGAAFFSFHLLLAYLVGHLSITMSFLISSIVSIFLVASYMRLVIGNRYAFGEIALFQLVYLVMFSYSFFFESFTGLAITILAVLTLFATMQITGRMDWEQVFQRKKPDLLNRSPRTT